MQFLLGKNSFGQQLGWRNVHYRASFVRFRDQSRYKKPYLSSLIILHGMQYYTDSRFSSDLRFIIIASRLLTLFFPDSQLKVEKTFIRQEHIYTQSGLSKTQLVTLQQLCWGMHRQAFQMWLMRGLWVVRGMLPWELNFRKLIFVHYKRHSRLISHLVKSERRSTKLRLKND